LLAPTKCYNNGGSKPPPYNGFAATPFNKRKRYTIINFAKAIVGATFTVARFIWATARDFLLLQIFDLVSKSYA